MDKYGYSHLNGKDSIYNTDNPYGYILNVNHPLIRLMYERYKNSIGEIILSDAQRHRFETAVIRWLEDRAEKGGLE